MQKLRPNAPSNSHADEFARSVDAFLGTALTPELRAAGRETIGVHSEIGACRIWHRRLHERGWIAPAWPVEFGGTGWSPSQRLAFDRACAENDAPILFAGGLRSLGPLLIELGSAEQRQRYLPAILDGSDLWCQGFSEANAGSDLASLSARAVRRGDRYIVSGTKLWTTGAQIANRMFCLARTAATAKPQAGITFLLVDMKAGGVSINPIRTLDGEREFNEVVLNQVEVSVEDRVGDENAGWAVAKRLMSFARGNNTTSGLLRRAWRRAAEAVARFGADDTAMLRIKLKALEAELDAFEGLELRKIGDGMTAAEASMLKTLATELHQKITTLALESAAHACLGAPEAGNLQAAWLAKGELALKRYLSTRAASIYSGTNETHRNSMAAAWVLGRD